MNLFSFKQLGSSVFTKSISLETRLWCGNLRLVNFFRVFLALTVAFSAWSADAAWVNGHDYTSLASWAASNHFGQVPAGRANALTLTNRFATRLVFEKNSDTVVVNGLNVALSYPVALDKTGFLIAQLDLSKTVEPLVYAPLLAPKKITTICLDPGHGGKDSGKQVGSHTEKVLTLLLAAELREQLQRAGFRVIQTRTKDTFVDLPERPALANRQHADLFVCLHFNAFTGDPQSVQGLETYVITPVGAASSNAQGEGANHGGCVGNRVERRSLLLAYQVHRALVKNVGVTDRSLRRARFAVLRDAEMPAVYIEGGYLTHPAESKKIYAAAYRKQMAAAIVQGIVAYQKLTAPPAPPKVNPASTNKVAAVTAKK